MTECIQESFSFTAHFSRRVQAEFTAGRVSSDGGALLLREADRRINLLGRLSGCFLDGRAPLLVKHDCRRCWRSVSMVWRWVMKIFAITSSCARIRCWDF